MTLLKKLMWIRNATFVTSLSVALTLTGCSSSDDTDAAPNTPVAVSLSSPQVLASHTTQFIEIKAPGAWNISFEYDGDAKDWCSANPSSGTGSTSSAAIKYTKNTSEEARTAKIILASGAETATATLTQLGVSATDPDVDPDDPSTGTDPDPDPSNTLGNWMELPKINLKSNEMTVTHNTTLNGKTVRNFSMLFDKNEGIAYWVAYPHYGAFVVSTGRTNDFKYDPKVPSQYQMSSTISGYDRGHQIPSGDRTSSAATNRQTFYYSNMTPQLGVLNQRMWASLEGQVRNYLSACDTLYVVTGAILKTVGGTESVKYVTDKVGHKIAVPNYYYKVLLRLKSGSYDAIGFWFEHKSYGTGNAGVAQAKTVRDIETLTGFDFFTNLDKATQDRVETEWKPGNWSLK